MAVLEVLGVLAVMLVVGTANYFLIKAVVGGLWGSSRHKKDDPA